MRKGRLGQVEAFYCHAPQGAMEIHRSDYSCPHPECSAADGSWALNRRRSGVVVESSSPLSTFPSGETPPMSYHLCTYG